MKLFRKILLWVVGLFFGSSIFFVALYRFVPVPVTPLMIIRAISPKGTEKQAERERHWRHDWVPMEEIAPAMPRAVIAREDQRFYDHNGFDWVEIKKITEGKRRGGGSTITQQTAKNLFLWPGHSWVRKGLEAYFTVLIELMWPKERILEVYLNSIEFGGGIYGIQAAAEFYYNKDASQLTPAQCRALARILPAPLKRNPR